MVDETASASTVVLTPPLALEGGLAAEMRPPNVVQRILSLFRNMRPGSDLTHFQLPPLFNMPKSQLQCYGEGVYCIGEDYLSMCSRGRGRSSLERFVSVVAWSISTTRPAIFGLAPFNPILGETHHVSKGNLNVLLEQISHHPPISALHATDTEENIELVWCQNPVPKFYGTCVDAVIHGKRKLKLLSHNEEYEMNAPNLVIRFLPAPGAEWSGTVRVQCKESGLEAEICYYRGRSFLGFGGNSRCVKGKIYYSGTKKIIYEIDGHWDRTISLKDVEIGEIRDIYDAKKAISKLQTPILKKPIKELAPTESVIIWGETSQSIINKDWDKAREAKRNIEERERRLARERKEKGELWVPRHFSILQTKDAQWECSPLNGLVPQAPIIVK